MPLPEIPESYFKLINLLWMIALSILGVLGYQKIGSVEQGQGVTHQKQDATAEKIDATERKVDSVGAEQKAQKSTITNTALKVGAKLNGDK